MQIFAEDAVFSHFAQLTSTRDDLWGGEHVCAAVLQATQLC